MTPQVTHRLRLPGAWHSSFLRVFPRTLFIFTASYHDLQIYFGLDFTHSLLWFRLECEHLMEVPQWKRHSRMDSGLAHLCNKSSCVSGASEAQKGQFLIIRNALLATWPFLVNAPSHEVKKFFHQWGEGSNKVKWRRMTNLDHCKVLRTRGPLRDWPLLPFLLY